MSATVTKTLQATFAPPTAHKERKLRATLSKHCEALAEVFEAGCETQTTVNDIVTPYDLTSYAKDVLKNYVPGLADDAEEIEDDHPTQFTERGFTIDYSPERDHAFCWQVPQAGRGGTNFWIPLRVNPAQRELWHDLLNGDADVGQFRLQSYRSTWELHVTVEYEVQEPDYEPTDDDTTSVGFDIGEAHLLAGCARTDGSPTDPLLVNGGRARHLRKEMHTTLKRLQEREAVEWRIDERLSHYQNALTDIVEKASRRAVEYAHCFEKPVIVLEELAYIRENLDYGKWMNRRLHAWAFARLQGRIEDTAREATLPVESVNAASTSQTCHACDHLGYRDGDEFRCQTDDCWVSEYHADINAAVNIAEGLDPWGESLPLNPDGDDILPNGRTCDSTTTPAETSPPGQMTLSAYRESEPTSSD